MTDIYRKNVGIVVFNNNYKVLLCARADKKELCWLFPQGGVEPNEDFIQAALRELKEETGISSVEIVATLENPLRYKFPHNILAKRQKNGHPEIGQEQQWVLVRFLGTDKEINFQQNPDEIEFKAFEWADIAEAPLRVVDFKKDVYNQVAEAFAQYLK